MITPLSDRLAIEPLFEERSSVLWTPEESSRWGNGRRCTRGRVLALGKSAGFAKVGDIVHFSDSCMRPFKVEDQTMALIRTDDIVGVEQ